MIFIVVLRKGEPMDDKHKKIEPEKLKAGMDVAYPRYVVIGWRRHFRYPMWLSATVKRVTPKRTKVVLARETGATIEVNLKEEALYEIDADMAHENECIEIYRAAYKVLGNHESNKWRPLWDLSDVELKEVYPLITALDKIMKRRTDE